MRKSDEKEKYDPSFRILQYEADDAGQCVARSVSPEFTSELADEWYEVKAMTWRKIKKEIMKGTRSPIHLFIEYNHMTVKDTAARMGMSVSAVKKHLDMEGFMKLDVKTLRRYGRVFNVPVSSFFQFLEYRGELKFETSTYHGGLIQEIKVSA